jgi:protein involved in polysaccharide export with SLBB domain
LSQSIAIKGQCVYPLPAGTFLKHMKQSIANLLGITAAYLLVGCSGSSTSLEDSSVGAATNAPTQQTAPKVAGQPPTSTVVEQPATAMIDPPKPTTGVQPLASQSVDPDQYQLGPGDKLRVIVFNESDLSGEFVVAGGGAVNLPLIGAVEARGATVGQFQDRIAAKLRDGFIKEPKVSVEVLNYRPFFIIGEVTKTGEFPYKAGLTVQDAVGVAGGYTYRANTKAAYIRRAGQDREEKVDLRQRVPINPGDSVRIPERFF